MSLTAKDVAEITRLLEESSFDELHLELEGLKLTLRRGSAAAAQPFAAAAPTLQPAVPGALPPASPIATPAPVLAQSPAPAGHARSAAASVGGAGPVAGSAGQARAPAAGGAANSNLQEVPAPLLGTFYRSPKPGAPPFIEVGSQVEEDTIIGIIEVMKLMNTVRAGVRGTVAEILARDATLVEYGEILIRVSKTN